jgi:Ca-activated chloride channel family protein
MLLVLSACAPHSSEQVTEVVAVEHLPSQDKKVAVIEEASMDEVDFESDVMELEHMVMAPPSARMNQRLLEVLPSPPVEPLVSHEDEYTDHGVHPFTQTVEDRLSTFSVDVDTASYTQARRRIQDGRLPDLAAIRVEEFINYFDYGYDSTDANPFIVHMEGVADPFRPDQHILRVGVQGKRLTAEERPSLRLTFLVDISGSMSAPDKLPLAQKSMHMLVDSLREDDSVALVTYAGAVRKVLAPTYGDEKEKIHLAIDQLMAGGSTAMSSGLDLAYEQAWDSFKDGAENRVVVLSDGDANVGDTSWESMLNQIKSFADRGVTMSTIGLGMGNYKDTRMEQLANKGDGNNYYVDSQEEAKKIFVDGFQGTMITIARDVKIQMDFNPETVESYRLIGYENRDIADKDFRNDRVDAGEVGAGHSVTALYGLQLKSPARFDTVATARLRYESPGADKAAKESAFLFRAEQIRKTPSSALAHAYTAAGFAEILRKSPYAKAFTLADLLTYGETHIGNRDTYTKEMLSLIAKSSQIKE